MSIRSLLRRLRRQPRRRIVLGLPGTGKSTLVRGWPEATEDFSGRLGGTTPVVYLIDARALCGCLAWAEDRNLEKVRQEIAALPSSRVVIVVTHADEDCRIPLMAAEYDLKLVPGAGLYRSLVTQELVQRDVLSGRPYQVVAGTLRNVQSTRALIRAITAEFARPPRSLGPEI